MQRLGQSIRKVLTNSKSQSVCFQIQFYVMDTITFDVIDFLLVFRNLFHVDGVWSPGWIGFCSGYSGFSPESDHKNAPVCTAVKGPPYVVFRYMLYISIVVN